MKRNIFTVLLIALILSTAGCKTITDMMKTKITVSQSIEKKRIIEQAQNPARKSVLEKDLENKRVTISNAVVKKVIDSPNIDYDFCVIVDIATQNGTVECYIFSHDIKTMAKLVSGSSRINAEGDFSRFFTLQQSGYNTLEITDAKITIVQ